MMGSRSKSEDHKPIKYINKDTDPIKRVNFPNAAIKGDRNPSTEIRKIGHIVKLASTSIDRKQSDVMRMMMIDVSRPLLCAR